MLNTRLTNLKSVRLEFGGCFVVIENLTSNRIFFYLIESFRRSGGFSTERIRAGKIEAKLRLVQYIEKRNECKLNGLRESSAALFLALKVQR